MAVSSSQRRGTTRCGGSWGRFGIVNGNCENCAAGGGVLCLMKGNTFSLCGYTPSHLGWSPQLMIRNYGHTAGGWRVDQHPRFLADTSAARHDLGFEATADLETGLRGLVEWWRAERAPSLVSAS